MNAFDQLHPALQHHVVNSLGWQSLRPLQDESVRVVLEGGHALLIAPTAGGKTEAAILPLLSRMLHEEWTGISVLYLCPIKALLNNLHDRLAGYCNLVGRRCGIWHGDIGEADRKRIRRDPPDILLTTPESLEAMLISIRTDHQSFFEGLQAVVVDEIHAFAGDDRGAHLLAVMERIAECAGRDVQRVGLSATVGNPPELLEWLAGSSEAPRQVVNPPHGAQASTEVTLDYVGSLENAATVISRLHAGEKRLVFCDSRARVEKLANMLRQAAVETFVSHSSLSTDERLRAELAFGESRNCVIVATSALELGIDVGDLDRVIQIDAPSTVSSFLQRMGRTGRRADAKRNCLFLATSEPALIQGAALICLWGEGFVEPVQPPGKPYHLLAQQILALLLQDGAKDRVGLVQTLLQVRSFRQMGKETIEILLEHMLSVDILSEDLGILWFGLEGEKRYGFRNFINLSSIFDTPPMFTVLCGRSDVGFVDEITFHRQQEENQVLLLSGRSWLVREINYKRMTVQVEPSQLPGRSQWSGTGPALSWRMSQAIREVLLDKTEPETWSRRAMEAMKALREDFAWIAPDQLLVEVRAKHLELWTFAGMKVNNTLALHIQKHTGFRSNPQNLMIKIEGQDKAVLFEALTIFNCSGFSQTLQELWPDLQWSEPKFGDCLPAPILSAFYQDRYTDLVTTKEFLESNHAFRSLCNKDGDH